MLATISKTITERWGSCRFLLAALKRQGPRVAEILLQHAHQHLVEGDAVPDFLATIVSLRRRLGDSMDRLMALDQEVFAIRASLTALRGERNDLASSLGKAIVRMRRRVMSHYQDPDLKQLGLQSPKVWKANPLVRQADLIEEVFAREDVETLLGEPFYDDPFDAAKTVAPVKQVHRDLGSVLDQIDDGLRLSDELFLEREEAKKEHDVLFTYTARTFEGFCRLAGLEKLAERVRPSKKRPGRFARRDDGESPGDDAGDSEVLVQAVPDLEENGLGSPEPAAVALPSTPREPSTSMRESDRDRRVTVDASDRVPTASRSSPPVPSSDVTTISGASTRLSSPLGRSP